MTYCPDDMLGYQAIRTAFTAGQGLALDPGYRRAHLPLLAPEHPDVIPSGNGYEMGRHGQVYSIAVPIDGAALAASPAYQELIEHLRAATFAAKLAWFLLDRRQAMLHATICESMASGEPPAVATTVRHQLSEIGPVSLAVRGLFSGNVNVGRLYLRIYPECRAGTNVFHQIQRAFDRPETNIYLVGMFNFVDHLNAAEATALAALLQQWWDRPFLELSVDHLWLLGTHDDLVLDSHINARIPLTSQGHLG